MANDFSTHIEQIIAAKRASASSSFDNLLFVLPLYDESFALLDEIFAEHENQNLKPIVVGRTDADDKEKITVTEEFRVSHQKAFSQTPKNKSDFFSHELVF